MENPADAVVPRYQELTYELAAGEEVTIATDATIFTALAATVDFAVAFNGQPATNFKQGLSYRAPAPLRSVRLVNTAGIVNTVTVGLARGDIRDQRLSLNSAVEVENVPGARLGVETRQPQIDIVTHEVNYSNGSGVQQLIGANPDRRKITLWTNNNMLLHDGPAAQGFDLLANGYGTVHTTAAVYMSSGSNCRVTMLEEVYA